MRNMRNAIFGEIYKENVSHCFRYIGDKGENDGGEEQRHRKTGTASKKKSCTRWRLGMDGLLGSKLSQCKFVKKIIYCLFINGIKIRCVVCFYMSSTF